MTIKNFTNQLFRRGLRTGFVVMGFLLACSGGGPGGPAVGDKGNWAAGPMPMPAPASISKEMIYCENVPGPYVDCHGKTGAVDPNAKVTVTVRAPGYARFWEKIFISTAYAVPGFSAFGFADPAGAFGPIKVLAVENEVLEIQSCVPAGCSQKLLLKVPEEGGVVSGVTGTMKNLEFGPGGDAFHSRNRKGLRERFWSWLDRLIPSAHAQELPPFPSFNATCETQPVNWMELPKAQSEEGACHIMRTKAGQTAPETFFSIPTCEIQDDIHVIRRFTATKEYLAVGVQRWLYILDVQGTGDGRPQVFRRIAFPYEVRDVRRLGNHLLVFLGKKGMPPGAYKFYLIPVASPSAWTYWEARCETNLGNLLDGMKEVISADGTADTFLFAASFEVEGREFFRAYHVDFGDVEGMVNTEMTLLYQSTHPLEVASLGLVAEHWRSRYAVLEDQVQKLHLVDAIDIPIRGVAAPPTVIRREFSLGEFLADTNEFFQPRKVRRLAARPDGGEIAFLDIQPDYLASHLAVLPLRADEQGQLVPGRRLGLTPLDYTPSVLRSAATDAGSHWVLNKSDNSLERLSSILVRYEPFVALSPVP